MEKKLREQFHHLQNNKAKCYTVYTTHLNGLTTGLGDRPGIPTTVNFKS